MKVYASISITKVEDGAPGVSVTSVVIQYISSENKTTAPSQDDPNWTNDLTDLDWSSTSYIWSREKFTYSDGNTTYSTPIVDNALAVVASWCSSENKTHIDGGKIYTGSITSEKLNTNAITSLNYVPGTTGSKLDLADGTFDSKHFKVDNEGRITATEGSIGNWAITDKYIGNKFIPGIMDNQVVGISPGVFFDKYGSVVEQQDSREALCFWAGTRAARVDGQYVVNPNTAPFKVYKNGSMEAASGTIGGWTITDNSIESYKYDGDNGSVRWVSLWSYYPKHSSGHQPNHLFMCREYHDGVMNGNYTDYFDFRADGTITARKAILEGGTIGGWTIGSVNDTSANIGLYKSGVYEPGIGMLAASGSNPAIWAGYTGGTTTPYTCTGSWRAHTRFYVTGDGEFVSQIVSNSSNYNFESGYSYAAWDARAALRIAVGLETATDIERTRYDIDGDGKITAADARLISRRSVGLENDNNRAIAISFTQEGLAINDEDYVIFYAGRQGVYMHEVNTAVATTDDTSSDINVKNNIELLTDDYDTLFDNLIPRRFKYNHGTSNRYHTGFVAQEMVEALEKSNLTTQDFATVVHLDTPLDNGAEWALRKEEMVALNTWQIQKLKARVAELEEKIKRLEV